MLRFQGGATWLSKQQAARKFADRYRFDAEKMRDMAELMRLDCGHDTDPEEVPTMIADWGSADAVRKRGMYVPRSAWKFK